MDKRNAGSARREKVQIVVPGVPWRTVEKIDEMARKHGRTRAGQVRVFLERVVREDNGDSERKTNS